ncbi:ATP-grasp domain-containing protein, partial [Hyphomonas sp.]|uniref:ATP-grasp domain-containing protein n=1 Tax=Hyphomonas sp. TaxID=87 RepID=UPI000C5EA91E|nr:succinate--CoA ligase subunit beta [Hyphomonas sp.]
MNIHEYQAKAVLKSFGAPVADGVPVLSLDDVQKAVDTLPGPLWVVKSQIHAGGRGKGKFVEPEAGEKGGVRLAFSKEDVMTYAKQMLGHHLVTAQTGPAGKQVNRLYIEDGAVIDRELYLSILIDRTVGRPAFVVSTEGGMDIEAVAEETPEKILTLPIDPETGVTDADSKKLNKALKLTKDAAKDGMKLFPILYKAFTEKDMSLLEV